MITVAKQIHDILDITVIFIEKEMVSVKFIFNFVIFSLSHLANKS